MKRLFNGLGKKGRAMMVFCLIAGGYILMMVVLGLIYSGSETLGLSRVRQVEALSGGDR